MARRCHAIDWKEAAAYAPLLRADRSIFAWEWLRRDPAYRSAALARLDGSEAVSSPGHWGLHAYEDPERRAPGARPVWTSELYPGVLEAEALAPTRSEDRIELRSLNGLWTAVQEGGRERYLLSDGLRTIRIDLVSGSLVRGPALLRYRLAGFASAEGPLLALRRLLALARTGRFSSSLHAPEARARRWILLLRTHDALASGAGQREIAEVLLSASADGPRWRMEVPSLRSRAQRLVRAARQMKGEGYRALLKG